MKNILNKLNKIQVELKAPKSQFNKFGNYKYRNSEDILEALKPLLEKYKAAINITDEIILVGDRDTVININDEINGEIKLSGRFYIKSTATLYDIESGERIEATAFAREEENKKGMDASQLTGSTSSYARKYALNGLLAIDDTKDSDTTNKHEKEQDEKEENNFISPSQQKRLFAIAKSNAELVKGVIKKYGHESTSTITKQEYKGICDDIEHLIEVAGE